MPIRLDVRYGSFADISQRSIHVRFTPENGHSSSPMLARVKLQESEAAATVREKELVA